MKSLLITFVLRLIGREEYSKLSKNAVKNLMSSIANEEGFERLPDFLQQCADTYRNQYLYTGDERFKGSVLAFVELRNLIVKSKKKTVKKDKDGNILTKKAKSGKVKKVSY